MTDDLASRLRKLDAVSSLVMEREVADKLRALGWNAVHGFFYQDAESGKYREVDVSATIFSDAFEDVSVDEFNLTMVVECKSGTESNLIVVPYVSPGHVPPEMDLTPVITTRHRVMETIRSDLHGEIAEHFPVPDAIEANNTLWRRYNDFAASVELEEASIAPPRSSLLTTTYRETSGIKEKDTDNSVLWRAYLGVYSAITALESQFLQYASEKVCRTFHEVWDQERNIYKALSAAISCAFGLSQQYHPVIVTHARLWMLDDDNHLREVLQFRFLQVDSLGLPVRWIDVVNVNAFGAFAEAGTEHYRSRLEMMGLTAAQRLYSFLMEDR